MQNLFSQLLRLGIIISLSDREAFVSKVSGIIERYEKDPEKAEKWAQSLVEYLKDTRANINLESSIKSAVSGFDLANNENVEELTKAIMNLPMNCNN